MVFADRADAGRRLAAKLTHLRGEPVVVLGLPRGGVPVALEVARVLGAPLDVIIVRKLGVPFQPELGMGAIGEDGVRVINWDVVRMAGVSEGELAAVQAAERAQVEARAARYRANVFDIELLAGRLTQVTGWLRTQPHAARAAVGYFGASTGAAAALRAAAEPGSDIAAVVSRGGRPDLARPHLAAVTAPTLLIVGGRDQVVLDLNRRAQAELHCENHLAIVPGATHLFEEPGTLTAAAVLARDWFITHFTHSPDR